jgi:tol-pal system protein YbgF
MSFENRIPSTTMHRFLAALLLAGFGAAAPVSAQNTEGGAGDMSARFILELQQMREEVRELRGLVESQAQELENLKRRQRDQYLDLDRRIGGIEGAAGASMLAGSAPRDPASAVDASASMPGSASATANGPADGSMGDGAPAVPPPSDLPEVREPIDSQADITTLAAPTRTDVRELQQPTEAETQAYDQAFLALRETRYADAAEGFDRFLQDHPQSSLAPNALYWLGEVYYVTRDFETALGQFNQLLERYPGSGKEPDALLKIGFSHYELEHWIEARAALQQVAEQFPGTNYSRLAENRLRTMRLEGRL